METTNHKRYLRLVYSQFRGNQTKGTQTRSTKTRGTQTGSTGGTQTRGNQTRGAQTVNFPPERQVFILLSLSLNSKIFLVFIS